MKKRVLTLISGITETIVGGLGIIGGVLLAIIGAIAAELIVSLLSLDGTVDLGAIGPLLTVLFIIFGLIAIGISVIFLIFGIKSIKRFSLSADDFSKKKGGFITIIVFECIFAGLALVGLFSAFDVTLLISVLIFIAVPVLKIVDLTVFEKKRIEPASVEVEKAK